MQVPEDRLRHTVRLAMEETFAGMAFIILNPKDETTGEAGGGRLKWASIEIKEPLRGSLTIALSPTLVSELYKTLFLGEEEGQHDIDDLLKEMVNTLAGRCMNGLVPEDELFSLGMPRVGEGAPETGQGRVFHFQTDEGNSAMAIVALAG